MNDPLRRFAVGLETSIAQDTPPAEVRALAASNSFPGAVPAQAPRGKHAVTIDTAVPAWHSLGLYAAPGETVIRDRPQHGHSLEADRPDRQPHGPALAPGFVGTHPPGGSPVPDPEAHTTAANALGGLIYIDVPGGTPSRKVEVTIDGAVEAPFYQLGVTTRRRMEVPEPPPARPLGRAGGPERDLHRARFPGPRPRRPRVDLDALGSDRRGPGCVR